MLMRISNKKKKKTFQTWKHRKTQWIVGEFEISEKFWTHPLNFEFSIFLALMSLKYILNSLSFWNQGLIVGF